jgi:hypothetical protein
MSELRAGVYRHHKGEYYLVLGLAHHSEDPNQHFVVYVPLYVREGPRICVRPEALFFDDVEEVCPECGTVGQKKPGSGRWYCPTGNRFYAPIRPRFTYVGTEVEQESADA